jgi:hypothetical protein
MTTRIFTLMTGRRAARSNNGLTFSLKELPPDDGGEVVIHSDTGTDVTVLTDNPVIARGIERDHITSAGHDVSGFAYCRFATGITVFYPRSHRLCIKESEPL